MRYALAGRELRWAWRAAEVRICPAHGTFALFAGFRATLWHWCAIYGRLIVQSPQNTGHRQCNTSATRTAVQWKGETHGLKMVKHGIPRRDGGREGGAERAAAVVHAKRVRRRPHALRIHPVSGVPGRRTPSVLPGGRRHAVHLDRVSAAGLDGRVADLRQVAERGWHRLPLL